jgi:hypothetical protein
MTRQNYLQEKNIVLSDRIEEHVIITMSLDLKWKSVKNHLPMILNISFVL